jgi:hypothetical protein
LPEDWPAYFAAVKTLELGFLRGRRAAPGFSRLRAEQHYALYFRACRAGAGGSFLRTLARADAAVLPSLPWMRMAAATVRR